MGRHPFSSQQTPENDPEQPGRIFYSAKTEGRQNTGIMSPGVYDIKLYCVFVSSSSLPMTQRAKKWVG